jgi:hypothetical protein
MMGTPPCDNYPRGHPECHTHSDVAFRPWLPTSQIIVRIEIEIEIGIGIEIEIEIETIPVQYGTSPSEHHSTLTAAFCQHRNNTVS